MEAFVTACATLADSRERAMLDLLESLQAEAEKRANKGGG